MMLRSLIDHQGPISEWIQIALLGSREGAVVVVFNLQDLDTHV